MNEVNISNPASRPGITSSSHKLDREVGMRRTAELVNWLVFDELPWLSLSKLGPAVDDDVDDVPRCEPEGRDELLLFALTWAAESIFD